MTDSKDEFDGVSFIVGLTIGCALGLLMYGYWFDPPHEELCVGLLSANTDTLAVVVEHTECFRYIAHD